MISPDFFVEKLCEMTGDKDANRVLVWSEDLRGGYSTEVNGVKFRLSAGVRLTLQKGILETIIDQPTMHISRAPIGKFFQHVSQSAVQSINSSSDSYWPRPPSSAKEIEEERLRLALGRLFNLVTGQQAVREKYQRDETVRSSLFETVLGYTQKKV